MILHIPHSSKELPKNFKVFQYVSIEKELNRMTDSFTDELYAHKEATPIVFPYSRIYCDVERFRADYRELMALDGMGVCYDMTSFGTPLRKVSEKEKEFIKSTIYDEHHNTFTNLVQKELDEKGYSFIVDCHSFPNNYLAQHEEDDLRPDICLGTDDYHTPEDIIIKLKKYFEEEGFSVEINKPFSGTIVPMKFYQKENNVKSIMIEVNRKLYLTDKFEKSKKFINIKKVINKALDIINT